MAKPVVQLHRLGRLTYVKALSVQQVLFNAIKDRVTPSPSTTTTLSSSSPSNLDDQRGLNQGGESNCSHWLDTLGDGDIRRKNSLLLVEHEPVYTIGLRDNLYGDAYVDKLRVQLERHNSSADFVKTNRGGLITFHGPGQLVAYPILYLGDFHIIKNRSVKAYVSRLEATIIDTLARVGLKGAHTVQEYPGVWLDGGQRKIAFVGIACKRYVTMHGISINCNCDLNWFKHIVSCGIEDKAITSIHREMLSNYQSNVHEVSKRGSAGYSSSPSPISSSSSKNLNSDRHSATRGQHQRFNVDQVSKAFCESFSHFFDCNLHEEQTLDQQIANIITTRSSDLHQ